VDTNSDAHGALSFGDSVRELSASVRALIADESDLLAAEAHVAMQSVVLCVILAVAAAVFAVLAMSALLGLLAAELVDRGTSLPVALGVVAVVCVALCAFLVLALKGLLSRKFFVGMRRQLRGQN
jgi:hypothetical protein